MFVTKKHHEEVKARALAIKDKAVAGGETFQILYEDEKKEVARLKAALKVANDRVVAMTTDECTRILLDYPVRRSLDNAARFAERYASPANVQKHLGMPPITKEQWEEAQRVYYADKAAEHTYKGQRKAGWMAGAGSVKP